MYYIDDYNSKTVSNNPPKKKMLDKLKSVSQKNQQQQLNALWQLIGITIGENFEDVKELLARYGYKVVNEEDAAVAIADIWKTPKWLDFVKDLGIIVEATVDEKMVENLLPGTDESSFVAAIITAVGAIAGGALGLASSKKQADAASENAKAQMIAALAQIKAERERAEAERAKAKASENKALYWIIGIVIVMMFVILGIVIYKRSKANVSK